MPPSATGCSMPNRSQIGVRSMRSSLGAAYYSERNVISVRCSSGVFGRRFLRPVIGLRFGRLQRFLILVAGRHRGRGAGQHLVVLDVEKPQPALLAEREPDHAAELDQ